MRQPHQRVSRRDQLLAQRAEQIVLGREIPILGFIANSAKLGTGGGVEKTGHLNSFRPTKSREIINEQSELRILQRRLTRISKDEFSKVNRFPDRASTVGLRNPVRAATLLQGHQDSPRSLPKSS